MLDVVVNVAGRGTWLWRFPGDEGTLLEAWRDGQAPMHLLTGWEGPRPDFTGELRRVLHMPRTLDAIVEIEDSDGILYVGDHALRWSEREQLDPAALAAGVREEVLPVVVVAGGHRHLWRFPGAAEELDAEVADGRWPAHLHPDWQGARAAFAGEVVADDAEVEVDDTAAIEVRLTIGSPGAATLDRDDRRIVAGAPVRTKGDAPSIAKLLALAPFEVEVRREKLLGLAALPDSDLEALAIVLAHPDADAVRHLDLRHLADAPRDIVAAITSRPRANLRTLRLQGHLTPEEEAALRALAPQLRNLLQDEPPPPPEP